MNPLKIMNLHAYPTLNMSYSPHKSINRTLKIAYLSYYSHINIAIFLITFNL